VATPVIPRELPNRDVNEAIAHHLHEAGDHVALSFVDALERAYRHISRHPASGPSRYAADLSLPHLRSWPLGRFPHVVFYVETEECINVWRVLHGARDIAPWMRDTGGT
jgi:toxin ParE1/3/4